jgi:hypothetical protein
MRNLATVFGLAISLCMLASGGAHAQDANQGEADNIQIDNLTCREMLKMDGDERKFTLIFLHGFVSGKKSDLLFDGSALADATDVILDNCIDSPDDSLLAVFEKARS